MSEADQHRARIIDALLGDDDRRRLLFHTSASFQAEVTMLAHRLPRWVDLIAEDAEAETVQLRAMQRMVEQGFEGPWDPPQGARPL